MLPPLPLADSMISAAVPSGPDFERQIHAVVRGCGARRVLCLFSPDVLRLWQRALWEQGIQVEALTEQGRRGLEALARLESRCADVVAGDGRRWPSTQWPHLLAEAGRLARDGVVLIPPEAPVDPSCPVDPSWAEQAAFAAGLRRHPMRGHCLPFLTADSGAGSGNDFLILQPVLTPPVTTDPLGRCGRDADALATLAHGAAEWVENGAEVAVWDGGSGWCAAILARRGELGRCTVLTEALLPEVPVVDPRIVACAPAAFQPRPGSLDLLVAVPLHPSRQAALQAAARIWLRPGGRLVVAMALDPEPPGEGEKGSWFHLRSGYDPPESATAELVLEAQFSLKEGASRREPEAPREWMAVDPESPGPELADWGLITVMRSPFAPITPEDRERRWQAVAATPVRGWWRDYDNPWLVPALVNFGSRVRRPRLLQIWAERALREARAGSPDQGAALCLLAYRLLEDPATGALARAAMRERVQDFQQAADGSPHACRWQVSLAYVMALLWQQDGALMEAYQAFSTCSTYDVSQFSATLGTKIVSAALCAGRLALGMGNQEAAARHWQQGMEEALRLLRGDPATLWGDPQAPLWVETRELAEMMDLAVECANALNSLATWSCQPGLIHEKVVWGRAGYVARLRQLETEQAGLRSEIFHLQSALQQEQHRGEIRMAELGGSRLKGLVTRGIALLQGGATAEGERVLAAAAARDPLWGPWFTTLTRLELGDLAAGFEGYEQRFALGLVPVPAGIAHLPAWTPQRPVTGRVLVWREQGLGDEILFASCLPDLLATGVQVTLLATPRLIPLFRRSFPTLRVLPAAADPRRSLIDVLRENGEEAGCDSQIPLGSLPRWFRPSLAAFPATAGYLQADPAAQAGWRQRLTHLPGRVLGFCWRGGSQDGQTPAERLTPWLPVLRLPGVRFAVLQHAPDPEEMAWLDAVLNTASGPARIFQPLEEADPGQDLDTLAAVLAACDGLVSGPVMTGDLAGALGIPVWRLGAEDDWVALGTAGRPWYPCLRRFPVASGDPPDQALAALAAAVAGFTGMGVAP